MGTQNTILARCGVLSSEGRGDADVDADPVLSSRSLVALVVLLWLRLCRPVNNLPMLKLIILFTFCACLVHVFCRNAE